MFTPRQVMTKIKSSQSFYKNIFFRFGGVLMVFALFTFSCKKPTAQYPSNKATPGDSADIIHIRGYNQELAKKEDSIITAFVAYLPGSYKKSDSGIWYFIKKPTKNPLLSNSPTAVFSYKMYTITGELLLQEDDKTIHFGKKEVIKGLEEGLKMMRKGEVARFIVPSFLRCDAQDIEGIPPYIPLAYEVHSK